LGEFIPSATEVIASQRQIRTAGGTSFDPSEGMNSEVGFMHFPVPARIAHIAFFQVPMIFPYALSRDVTRDTFCLKCPLIFSLCEDLIAPFTIEGACDRVVFEIWVETCLIPQLNPGDWVILDNATFHHGGRIQQLIEAASCHLLYLPPDSPDFNRIEKCWA
jgi:DDE superfamily endonuclease